MTSDDREFLGRFEEATLVSDEWTHRAHVKIAYLYVISYELDEAIARMREGVKGLNAALGIVDGPFAGYNETTTHAFMHLVAATVAAYDATFPTETADAFCDRHPQLMSKHVLRLFYSPGQRIHPDAKATFVPPDLTPLPKIERMPEARVPDPE